MVVELQVLVDEKLSNILRIFVELFMKDLFHLFNIIIIQSKEIKWKWFYSLFFYSYETMMQNYSAEWPSAEALKEHAGGSISFVFFSNSHFWLE